MTKKINKMEYRLKNIKSGNNTNISILMYIKNNVSIEFEINNIEAGEETDIQINHYFQKSPDYIKLIKRIDNQQKKVRKLFEKEKKKYAFEKKKLDELKNAEIKFKTGVLELAKIFLKIEVKTKRLRKAQELFEKGLILEADEVLVELDLLADQDILLAQMNYLKARKENIISIISDL